VRLRADHPIVAGLLRRGGSSVRREDGLTLVELLVTMAILGIVLVTITGAFMSGAKAETSVEKREQAQSDARLALGKLRDDIHCAFTVQSLAANPSGGYTLSLTEFTNQCATVASQPGSGSTVYLAWCTVPDPAHPGTFGLYRTNGACDATGTLIAADIVPPASGWPGNQPGNIWPVSRTCETGYFKTQAVRLAVNPDSTVPGERYELKDEIALRNSTRSVGCTGPGAPAQLVFTTQPSGAVASAAFPTSPVVTAEDGAGNILTSYSGTVALSIKSGTGTSGAALTGCSAVNVAGATTFTGCKIDKPGSGYVLVAADGVFSVESNPFNVTVGTAVSLAVAGYPSPTVSGVSQSFTVTAKDSAGNTATGYTGTVHFTSTDGAAVLPADYTFTAGDNGTHTFNATLKTAGTKSITATDTATGTITGSQTGINVTAGPAATLIVAGYPNPTVSGVSHTFTVTAKDANGNTATGYTGIVHFASSDGTAVLPPNYTFVAGDNGTHIFNATLKTLGTQSITATDTVTGSVTGSQTGITVNAGPVASFVVAGYPSPTVAGVSHTFTVTAKDAGGNTITTYAGTVSFTSSDGTAVLPPNYTFVAGDNGTHTFNATLKTAGTKSITATAGAITGSQTGITVTAGSLVVAGYPNPTGANVSHTFTVTAKDGAGATLTSYTGTVSFTSSDGTAVLPGSYTFVAGDNGTHTFNATLKTLGTQSITATDTVTGSVTGSQTGITVNAGPVASFVVAGYPSPTVAGVSHTFTVTAKDAGGNTVTTYAGTVSFTSSGAAVLPGSYTFVAGDNGTHTFNATLKTAGTHSITATAGPITGSQTGITVGAADATALAFINCSQPSGNTTCSTPITVGNKADMTFNVQTTDPYGNASAPGAQLTISITTGGNAHLTITSGSPSTIAPPSSATGQITLSHDKTSATATVTAHITSPSSPITDATMTVNGS
jgi:prepilin-type N-terminal cleavage/methylation domain-containing protein